MTTAAGAWPLPQGHAQRWTDGGALTEALTEEPTVTRTGTCGADAQDYVTAMQRVSSPVARRQ